MPASRSWTKKKKLNSRKSEKKKQYKNPIPTVDIILRRDGHKEEILVEKRARPPFKNYYSLPGGHVDYGEEVEHAALRELREETSLAANLRGILGTYSDPERDPRGQRITTVFLADSIGESNPKAGDDAESAQWFSIDDLLQNERPLAFDHELIISDYKRLIESGSDPLTFWSSKER